MEFSKQFIEIFDALAERIGIVIDWGSKNVVPYLQDLGGRLVNYEIATSVAWIVLFVIIIISTVLITKAIEDGKIDEFFIIFSMAGFFMSIIGVYVIGTQIFDIIEALTIPEKTIYDMIQSVL